MLDTGENKDHSDVAMNPSLAMNIKPQILMAVHEGFMPVTMYVTGPTVLTAEGKPHSRRTIITASI